MFALDFRVMPFSLKSRAIIALRISGVALSRNPIMVSRGHCTSGCDQSISGQASTS
jgi:hypothetical protein